MGCLCPYHGKLLLGNSLWHTALQPILQDHGQMRLAGRRGGTWLREPLSAALPSPPRGTGESKPGEQRGGNGGGVRHG